MVNDKTRIEEIENSEWYKEWLKKEQAAADQRRKITARWEEYVKQFEPDRDTEIYYAPSLAWVCFAEDCTKEGIPAELSEKSKPLFDHAIEIIVKGFYKKSYPPVKEIKATLADLFKEFIEGFADNDQTAGPLSGQRVNNVLYPLDKSNRVIWGSIWDLLEEDTSGQLSFNLKTEPAGQREVNLLYSINFDNIENDFPIVKRLDQYDKRVYIAIGALYDAGNAVQSLAQIYHAMGGTLKAPNQSQKNRIYNSLVKYQAFITLNNKQEIDAGYNYPEYSYEGPLLPYEMVRKQDKISGNLVDLSIHIFRSLPLLEFARGRKQITTISIETLQTPLDWRNETLAIEDYLIERIAAARTGRQPLKILYATVFERANIKSKKQRQRAPDKMRRILEHYQECNEIAGFDLNKDGITLKL